MKTCLLRSGDPDARRRHCLVAPVLPWPITPSPSLLRACVRITAQQRAGAPAIRYHAHHQAVSRRPGVVDKLLAVALGADALVQSPPITPLVDVYSVTLLMT